MEHKCIDHLDKFYFRDAQLHSCELSQDMMTWIASGVVARYNNPCNETLVDRYMETTRIRLKDAKITNMFLEGAKLYSADDVLLEEIPDTVIAQEDYDKTMKLFEDGIIFIVRSTDGQAQDMKSLEIAIDVTDPETDRMDTYWMEVQYEKVVLEWDHFLNKAMLE